MPAALFLVHHDAAPERSMTGKRNGGEAGWLKLPAARLRPAGWLGHHGGAQGSAEPQGRATFSRKAGRRRRSRSGRKHAGCWAQVPMNYVHTECNTMYYYDIAMYHIYEAWMPLKVGEREGRPL